MRRLIRVAVGLTAAAASTMLLAAPALADTIAGSSIDVLGAHRLTDGKSVQLTVAVQCHAPAGSTSYLSTTIWQGYYLNPNYREAQGQGQVSCDRRWHIYSFTATLTPPFADSMLTVGRSGTESVVQYCLPTGPTSTACNLAGAVHRERAYIHR